MPRNIFALLGLTFARAQRVPTVFTPHCFYPSTSGLKRVTKALADRTMTPFMFRCADVTINLTKHDQGDAFDRGLSPKRSRIIPNSVRVESLASTEEIDFRSRNDLPEKFILHVGRFDPVKNIDFLVSAHMQLPNVPLVLIGQDSGTLARIQAQIRALHLEPRVRIVEKASFAELCGAYRQASLLVMASSYEGLPTVLLEAMYFAAPCASARDP